ncbi:MAG: polysaccharide biosynthesis protein [Clostridia bacterium]|nr:polysaccharide biosynthesis protein [Clostridia bacterium]
MADMFRNEELLKKLLLRDVCPEISERAKNEYRGKTILVTGGGGSIGSHLCRALAECGAAHLVIFDIYENRAFELCDELSEKYASQVYFTVEIGSVRDRDRLSQLFSQYDFDVVFHAAAHKHVPLMERSPEEAVKNNIFGTYNVLCESEKHICKKVVVISTDKAVNPESVMGATKRFCEMMVTAKKDSSTSFSAVRFGNVAGSAGSLLPLLAARIERGERLCITDKRMMRYFMTCEEAASLCLEAGAASESGELFVLDMGRQINVYDIMCRLIIAMGLEPGRDVVIEETGIRPGEKLSERLLYGPGTKRTENGRIFIEKEEPLTVEETERRLADLRCAVETGDRRTVIQALAKAVPESRLKTEE